MNIVTFIMVAALLVIELDKLVAKVREDIASKRKLQVMRWKVEGRNIYRDERGRVRLVDPE